MGVIVPREMSLLQPATFLQSNPIQCGIKLKPRLKARWYNRPDSEDTWEDVFALHARFLALAAWGQAALEEVGSVMW